MEAKRRTFALSVVERAKADAWLTEHIKVCRLATPAQQEYQQRLTIIGGFISYIFAPNSAFDAVRIRCKCNNEEIDITDYGAI